MPPITHTGDADCPCAGCADLKARVAEQRTEFVSVSVAPGQWVTTIFAVDRAGRLWQGFRANVPKDGSVEWSLLNMPEPTL